MTDLFLFKKKPAISDGLLFPALAGPNFNLGNVLLSHTVTHAVPSALKGLTSVFGMGTGVSPPPWSPRNSKAGVMEYWSDGVMLKLKKIFFFTQYSSTPFLHYSLFIGNMDEGNPVGIV